MSSRRYDIDWLRIFALGLLMIYHAVIVFQPWGKRLLFIINKEPLESLWPIMASFNVWRIPILFLVAGLAYHYSMKLRNWKNILKERNIRLGIPLLISIFFLHPAYLLLSQKFYNIPHAYWPNLGPLWFVAFVLIYCYITLPGFLYLKNKLETGCFKSLIKMFQYPFGILLVVIPVIIESILVKPEFYHAYAMSWHGFWLGLCWFIAGFIFACAKDNFWSAIERIRYLSLILAVLFFAVRLLVFNLKSPDIIIAIESINWVFAVVGFGSKHLNKPSPVLSYLSKAVFPLYIISLPLQIVFSYFLVSLVLPAEVKLLLVVLFTIGGGLLLYELIIRRIKYIRPLFGLKLKQS